MVHKKIYEMCQGTATVSSELAQDPQLAPSKAKKKLFGHDMGDILKQELFKDPRKPATEEELQQALECGKWGEAKPSELFLRMYHDVLQSLNIDPLQGMTSPPLMGSSGTVPLTVVSTIPDICRHMSNCIVRAEKEVFLATNFWMFGEATKLISNSLRELSRRAGEKGERRVVKMMYDRGSPKQVIENHLELHESDWTAKAIQLPKASEMPNIDLQLVNYHRPVFGTFHCKFMIVDRRIAVISSNNIQDNDNLEMMVHMEGPIADSFYDMALISWHDALKPTLPMHNSPAAAAGSASFEEPTFRSMFDSTGRLQDLSGRAAPAANSPEAQKEPAADAATAVAEAGSHHELPEHTGSDPHYDPDIFSEVLRVQSVMTPKGEEGHMAAVTRHLNTVIQPDTKGDAAECAPADRMTPMLPIPAHAPFPMAMVCRKPWGAADMKSVHVPQNEAFLSALRNAKESVFIQTPNLNAKPLHAAIVDACRRGVTVRYYVCLGYNDAGELLPLQGGTNEMFAHGLYGALDEEGRRRLEVFVYVAKDMTHPIHNGFKKRSCHIKLLIADGKVGVVGNGNQDTQSWFHSQEINVMVDSPVVCEAWIEAIRRNENTHIYGRVWRGLEGEGERKNAKGKDKDMGCWYGSDGKQAEGAVGVDPGKFSWAKGFLGAVQRVRGAGGF